MKNRYLISTIVIFLLATIFYSCSEPVSPTDEVDPGLIGEWYYTNSFSYTYPSPDKWFYGIQITMDKKINSLGIETNTGKVTILDDSYKQITEANQGKLIIKYPIDVALITESFTYKIENEQLTLSDQYQNLVYTKTKLGDQIFDPVISNLTVKVDSIPYENDKISRCPSSYVSKKSSSEFLLKSNMNDIEMDIEIDNFTGAGSYEIPFSKAILYMIDGDAIYALISDSISTGNIVVNNYDEVNNICSGIFYFTAITPGYRDFLIKEIKDGIFSVPIYK